jgi:ABC-2 type transport system permease protein
MGAVADHRKKTLAKRLRSNPVTLKELRGRMRGARAFLVLTVYVGLMSAFAVTLYLAYSTSTGIAVSGSGGVIGKIVFGGVVGIELLMVCFIAPAFTAGAISGERERLTLDLLRTTLLPARSLVAGKLESALGYVVLLLLAGLPLQSLAFLMGGVTMIEMVLSLLLMLVSAVAFATVGLFFSSVMKRTLAASVLTYACVLAAMFGLPLLFVGFIPVIDFIDVNGPLVEVMLIYGGGFLACTNPIATIILTEVVLQEERAVFFFTVSLSNGGNLPLVSPWIVYVLVYSLLSLVLIWLSVRSVRQVSKT